MQILYLSQTESFPRVSKHFLLPSSWECLSRANSVLSPYHFFLLLVLRQYKVCVWTSQSSHCCACPRTCASCVRICVERLGFTQLKFLSPTLIHRDQDFHTGQEDHMQSTRPPAPKANIQAALHFFVFPKLLPISVTEEGHPTSATFRWHQCTGLTWPGPWRSSNPLERCSTTEQFHLLSWPFCTLLYFDTGEAAGFGKPAKHKPFGGLSNVSMPLIRNQTRFYWILPIHQRKPTD